MMFAADCWRAFKSDTPLLYRHRADQVAGRVLDIVPTAKGLFVEALVCLEAAKVAPAFSLAATIHRFEIINPDDRDSFHVKILDASLEEISMALQPVPPRLWSPGVPAPEDRSTR